MFSESWFLFFFAYSLLFFLRKGREGSRGRLTFAGCCCCRSCLDFRPRPLAGECFRSKQIGFRLIGACQKRNTRKTSKNDFPPGPTSIKGRLFGLKKQEICERRSETRRSRWLSSFDWHLTWVHDFPLNLGVSSFFYLFDPSGESVETNRRMSQPRQFEPIPVWFSDG